jgi:hypothetical protein
MLATFVQEQAEVPIMLAAQMTGLDPLIIRKLVRDGVIRGMAPYRVPEVVGWCDINQAREVAVRLIAARDGVEGNKILVADAMKKYKFSSKGMYSWIQNGWISKAGFAQNGDLLINEGDVAFARCLADLTNHRQAKALFPSKRNKK